MGFFNNGKIREQQRRPTFSFFNGAALHCCQQDFEINAFIIHAVQLKLQDKVTVAEKQWEQNLVLFSPNISRVHQISNESKVVKASP